MMNKTAIGFVAGVVAAMSAQTAMADGHGEITVGYFLEWPMPMMMAKASGAYDEALGMKVNWVSFETGTAMSAAMASGDVQLSVSQGVPPFVVAASGGQDIQVVDVAVSYSDNDNCVFGAALEMDKDSTAELAGKKVAVPLGTAAHYGFLRQMDHFGVDISTLEIVDMDPPTGAAALGQGAVDFACGYGGGLARMKEYGNVLLTVAKFLKVTADANAAYAADPSDANLAIIAEQAGMDLDAAKSAISTMAFPTVEEQLSEKWLGGNAATFMKGVADVFVNAGSIDGALDSYEGAVNTGPLKAASEM